MASILQRSSRLFSSNKHASLSLRPLFTTVMSMQEDPESKQGILQKLFDFSSVSPIMNAHSKTLTANPATYELQFEYVKPEFMKEYLSETMTMYTKLSDSDVYPGKLLGSWTTLYGDCDKAVHLWVYKDGYEGASENISYLKEDKEIKDFNAEKGKWLRSRNHQLCHEFSFWGEPKPRKPSHIYELRTYNLKPGTLIEWGNKWGQAIQIRRKDAVGGFFSQVGDLYQVHHIWAYKDLNHRKIERETMWQIPGWDDCVASTVPLIRNMSANILQPTSFSPLQ